MAPPHPSREQPRHSPPPNAAFIASRGDRKAGTLGAGHPAPAWHAGRANWLKHMATSRLLGPTGFPPASGYP